MSSSCSVGQGTRCGLLDLARAALAVGRAATKPISYIVLLPRSRLDHLPHLWEGQMGLTMLRSRSPVLVLGIRISKASS